MGGCFVLAMGGVLAVGLAAAFAGLFGLGCVIAAIAVGIVFFCQRKQRAAGGRTLGWLVSIPIVLFCVGAPLAAFAFWLFLMP